MMKIRGMKTEGKISQKEKCSVCGETEDAMHIILKM
jgi:hypothetical protein